MKSLFPQREGKIQTFFRRYGGDWGMGRMIMLYSEMLCIVIAVLSVFSILGMDQLKKMGVQLWDQTLPTVVLSQEILESRLQGQEILEEMLATDSPERLAVLEQEIDAMTHKRAATYSALEKESFLPQVREKFGEMEAARADYLTARDKMISLLGTDHAAAARVYAEEVHPLSEVYTEKIDAMLGASVEEGNAQGQRLKDEVTSRITIILAIAACSILAGIAAALRIKQWIIRVFDSIERRVKDRTHELEKVCTQLEKFSHSVSHDLRNPLFAISSYSSLLHEDHGPQLNEEGRQYLARITNGCQRMGEIIDDLLSFSRATQQPLTLGEVGLGEMAERIAGALRERDPERKVDFRIDRAMAAPCDARLMKNVLENLLGNAWKYTGRHPRARIEFGEREEKGNRVFYVRDDGAGFDMEQAGHLFQDFQRLHDASVFEGTGIGLAIVARIIARHGGRIWAESAVERGATFFFTLGEPACEPVHKRKINFEPSV